MNDPAEKYFCSDTSCLFHWADGGKTLCWLDGTTIAFRDELVIVLERLASGCLPGFTSVVVAQAALRTSWPDVADRLTRVLRALQESAIPSYADAMRRHEYLTKTWPESVSRLGLLGRFVQSTDASLSERADLLARVFERLESPWDVEEQRQIARAFRAGLPPGWLFERTDHSAELHLPRNDFDEERWRRDPPLFHRVLHDFLSLLRVARVIAGGLEGDEEDSLARRVTSGLGQDLNRPEIDLLPDARSAARGLMDELKEDDELSGVANLARHVMAAVSLPRTLKESEESAAGGVSDISNRGELDRLLLSELVHDDMTLAVRVALNEALYLRRESPPQPQARVRSVFIDNCVPMWGVPRVYATAIAMALQAVSENGLRCDCWRAAGRGIEAVDLASRDGVIEHLNRLSPAEHPGGALTAFEMEMWRHDETQAEPVIITTADVLAHEDFRRLLQESKLDDAWIITAERDGALTAWHRTRQGLSVYRRAQLPLDEILDDADHVLDDVDDSLPAIFGLREFPLLLSHQTRVGRLWKWVSGAISLADDGRLMHWPVAGQGGRQLLRDLPVKKHTRCFVVERSRFCFRLLVMGSDPVLVTITAPGLRVRRINVEYPRGRLHGARIHAGVLLLFAAFHQTARRCMAVSLETGKQLSEIEFEASSQTDRCVYVGDVPGADWRVLSWGGTDLELVQLPDEYQTAIEVCETSPGRFIRITAGNELVDSEDENSPDRYRLVLGNQPLAGLRQYVPGSHWMMLQVGGRVTAINTEDGTIRSELHQLAGSDDLEFHSLRKHVKTITPHWKFDRIGITTGFALRLFSASGKALQIDLVDGGIRMCAIADHDRMLTAGISFGSMRSDGLRVAEWCNGGRAWLDRRGLLHLKSFHRKLAEVTFVMRDGLLSGWISDGRLFGPDDHCGSEDSSRLRRVSPEEAWRTAVEPVLKSMAANTP